MIRIEHRDKPLCFNGTGKTTHWTISNEIKKWREVMGWETKALRVRIDAPVGITVHHLRKKSYPVPDHAACFLAAKGAVDGLVDGGLIPSDGPEVVRWLKFCAPEVVGYDGLALEVEEL